MDINLSEDQKVAFDKVYDLLVNPIREDIVLVGAAGCGKTTLLRYVISEVEANLGRHCSLWAPTGKAASRLSKVTGREANTVHYGLYPRVKRGSDGRPVWEKPKELCGEGQLAIVDEASMVGRDLYNDIHKKLPQDAQVLYVGDREQLRPVNDTWGPALEAADGVLTKVHRQVEGNPILAYATAIRSGAGDDWAKAYDGANPRLQVYDGYASAVAWALDHYKAGKDSTVLTYTNAVRHKLNKELRQRLGRTGTICAGDKLLVRANNRDIGLMNGEVVTVAFAEPIASDLADSCMLVETVEGQEFLVNMAFFNGDKSRYMDWKSRFARRDPIWVHCDHGYVLTIHASQGSEWQNVCVILDDAMARVTRENADDGRRLNYTAVTRAMESLALVQL
jgi:exodeoxyribonuclease V